MELLQCPFCGSDSVTLHRHRSNNWRPQCDDCFANINLHGGREIAVNAWNARTPSQRQSAPDSKLEAYRKALEPFAAHADRYAIGAPDTADGFQVYVSLGECRFAREVLAKAVV